MAKQTTVTVIDDIDGTPGAQSVRFGLDGKSYEIDLADANSAKLREILAPFVEAARKVGSAPTGRHLSAVPSGVSRSASDKAENAAMREWLRAQGYTVKDRGRIPAKWQELYANRNSASAPAVEAVPVAPVADAHCTRIAKLSGAQVRALTENGLTVETGTDWAVLAGDLEGAVAAVRATLGGMNAKSPKGKALGAVLKKLQTGDESLITVAQVAQSA